MAVALTQTIIPDSFGKGGANIGDGTPTLAAILQQIQANLTVLADVPTTAQMAALDYVAAGNVDATHNKVLTAAQQAAAAALAGGVAATGTITCPAWSAVTNGDNFYFCYSITAAPIGPTFVAWTTGAGPLGTPAIDLRSATTRQDVAVALAAACNAEPTCPATLGTPTDGVLTWTYKTAGSVGNSSPIGYLLSRAGADKTANGDGRDANEALWTCVQRSGYVPYFPVATFRPAAMAKQMKIDVMPTPGAVDDGSGLSAVDLCDADVRDTAGNPHYLHLYAMAAQVGVDSNGPAALPLALSLKLVTYVLVDPTAGVSVTTTAAQKLGFHGATPIVQAVLATGAGRTVDNVIAALQNLGLVKQA